MGGGSSSEVDGVGYLLPPLGICLDVFPYAAKGTSYPGKRGEVRWVSGYQSSWMGWEPLGSPCLGDGGGGGGMGLGPGLGYSPSGILSAGLRGMAGGGSTTSCLSGAAGLMGGDTCDVGIKGPRGPPVLVGCVT